MKNKLTLLLVVLLVAQVATTAVAQNKLTPDLVSEISKTHKSELLPINIRLVEQYDPTSKQDILQHLNQAQVRSYIVTELKSFANASQEGLLKELDALSKTGEVIQVKPLWIANVINCYATPEAITQLANRSDIERIDLDEERILIDPVEITELEYVGSKEITYNVNIMNVPQVWSLGFTGEGIVVAVLDTGVNYDHDDLEGNMWSHADFPLHGWNFINNTNNPMDYHGHGTHCAGTVAGNGNAGSQTGMAPSVKIMALQVLGSDGGGTEAGVWDGIQFAVEHGANVMSLSLGWQHAWNPDRASWRDAMDNALAAGVIASVASGNEGGGSAPSNVRTPGDVPAPWRNPDQPDTGGRSAVVTIGATDASDDLAAFSSRGPVTWQNIQPYSDYPYNPGSGLITPDVTAPGVNVKSLSHSNTSGYAVMSGTSMAAPGAAGVMALVLSKNPWLKPAQLSQVLEETALAMTPLKSNTFGAGRVDALAAIIQTNFAGPVYVSHGVNDDEGNNNGFVNPQEFIKLSLTLVNDSGLGFENVETTITTESPYVSMVSDTVSFGSFEPGETIEIADAVSFNTSGQIPGGYVMVFKVESTDGNLVWKNSFSIMAHAPNMVIGSMLIDDSAGNGNGQLDPVELVGMSFDIFSNGQMDAINPELTITVSSPFLTIHNSHFPFETMPPSSFQTVLFDAEVKDFAPIGSVIEMVCNVQYGSYIFTRTFFMRVGLEVEGFEAGNFSNYNWDFVGHQPWVVTPADPYQGSFSAKSGDIDHDQMSVILLNYDVSADDSVSFYRRVSSEPTNDFLRFYINWQLMGEWSGEVDWDKVTYPVSAGSNSFAWMYKKNTTISSGEDAAWIDVVSFPLSPVTTAWAGINATICENLILQLQAYASNFSSIEWTSSGNGSFSDPNILNPVYTPGLEDIEIGQVTLTLTVSDGEESVTDVLLLTIEELPVQPATPAGPASVDLHKITQSSYQIESITNADHYEWVLEPEEAGALSADGVQATIAWNTDFLGNATLKVIAINHCGQSEVSQELEIELFNSVGIAEINLLNMRVFPNPSEGRFIIAFDSRVKTDGFIFVSNSLGETVYSEPIAIENGHFSYSLDLSQLSQGIYNLVVYSDQGQSSTRILIFR
ncbi:MAG: S8 family peptidase [Bacteroidales bacterium]|nr:S8 family peptidase [Bacteroidales bacterium]